MPDQPSPNAEPAPNPPAKPAGPVTLISYGLGCVVVACILAATINVVLDQNRDLITDASAELFLIYGLFGLPVVLILVGMAIVIAGAVRWGVHGRDGASQTNQSDTALLQSINERLLLSETAKKIAYRNEDLALLRRTIQEDMNKKDFDAALVLVQELAQGYGYKEEAESVRDKIMAARAVQLDAKVTEAIARLDELLARHAFEQAFRETLKLQRLYPESAKIRDLPSRVTKARQQYKAQLEQGIREANDRGEVDRAMDLLKELDKNLTPNEAESFREIAREVINKKRDNLSTQFTLAVRDEDFSKAVRIGEQIMRDFPNAKMAAEVRDMMDLIKHKAADQRARSSSAPPPSA